MLFYHFALIELIYKKFFHRHEFVNFDIESCVNVLDAELICE